MRVDSIKNYFFLSFTLYPYPLALLCVCVRDPGGKKERRVRSRGGSSPANPVPNGGGSGRAIRLTYFRLSEFSPPPRWPASATASAPVPTPPSPTTPPHAATSPRVAAHTFWCFDAKGGVQLECSHARCVERRLTSNDAHPIIQTNHCLEDPHVAIQGEPPNSSSFARLERARALAERGDHDVASLKALFADREDGVDSINRYPEDEQGTATNACMIALPAEEELWACKGPADRGEWRQLRFKR